MIGGGNTAVEEALFLTNFAAKVTLIHRRDRLRAERILQDRLFRNARIDVVWDHVVDEVIGQTAPIKAVEGVRLRHVKTGALRDLPVDGVFVAIGHTPNTELFRGQLDMDDDGYLITEPDSTATSVAGRLRRRRRSGQDLPAGGHRRRYRMHGSAGGGTLPDAGRRAGDRRAPRSSRCIGAVAPTPRSSSRRRRRA